MEHDPQWVIFRSLCDLHFCRDLYFAKIVQQIQLCSAFLQEFKNQFKLPVKTCPILQINYMYMQIIEFCTDKY